MAPSQATLRCSLIASDLIQLAGRLGDSIPAVIELPHVARSPRIATWSIERLHESE